MYGSGCWLHVMGRSAVIIGYGMVLNGVIVVYSSCSLAACRSHHARVNSRLQDAPVILTSI